jgi:hypothetical protein
MGDGLRHFSGKEKRRISCPMLDVDAAAARDAVTRA